MKSKYIVKVRCNLNNEGDGKESENRLEQECFQIFRWLKTDSINP